MRAPDLVCRIMDASFLPAYRALWQTHDCNSFFRSPAHLRMIVDISQSQLAFAVCLRGNEPVAALPFAVLPGPLGPIINALPFYGTYGAVVAQRPADHAMVLVRTVLDYARQMAFAAATFVDDWRVKTLADIEDATFVTERTNQFIDLRRCAKDKLLDVYHSKTRNLVRKAVKAGVSTRLSQDPADIDGLRRTHLENMAAINGIPKPDQFFDRLRDPARPLGEHALYVATYGGEDCAYLLNFHCGDTVEYYMPTVKLALRSLQPLSLLIDAGLRHSIDLGLSFWNFGGTWLTQTTLRHFKIRWGGEETVYCYHTFILRSDVLEYDAKQILAMYPYFFVAPFDRLAGKKWPLLS